ncbi:MAG: T9SS type A sorting domain-containing protein [Saprospiraceae bacterium]
MHRLKLTLYFIIFFQKLYAQHIDIEFESYNPRWYFIVKDTHFVPGSQSNVNSFNSITPYFHPYVEDTYSYITFHGANGEGHHDGSPLFKIRNEDGNIEWSHFLNTNNGDDQNFYTSFYVDDRIYMSGRKRTQKSFEINENWSLLAYSKPFFRIYDKNSGNLIGEYFDENDSIGENDIMIRKILIPFSENMKQIERQNSGILVSNLLENTVHISSQQLLPNFVNLLSSIVVKKRSLFINQNKQLANVMYYEISKDTSIEQHVGRLDYYRIQGDSLELYQFTDLGRYLKRPPINSFQDVISYQFSDQGQIIITKSYEVEEYPKVRNWALKLHANGEEAIYVDEVKLETTGHIYNNIIVFYVDEYNSYLMALPSSTGDYGVDIIRMKNDGSFHLLGSLTTGVESKLGVQGLRMNKKGDIVVVLQWENQYTAVMGMHISDFGINLNTEDNTTNIPVPLMTLSPNPASDRMLLEITDEKYRSGIAGIYDVQGNLLMQQKVNHGEYVDVYSLKKGSYILHFNPDARKGYFLTSKFVKVN